MTDPAPPARSSLSLDRPATHVDVSPGGEIVLRGSYTSTHDGSIIDAATTTWPAGAPGGASIDSGGLIDFEKGGLHLTSRDAITHEVHAVATGDAAPYCAAAGVAAPCLPLRLAPQGNSRLLTADQWRSSLKGGISVEVPVPPAYAPAAQAARSNAPLLAGTGAVLLAAAGAFLAMRAFKKRQASPRAQLLALARRVREHASKADPIVAAPLTPALDAAMKRLSSGRIDPDSTEGRRVRDLLLRVDTKLSQTAQKAQADEERRAADDLVHEVESALEAADETLALDARQGRLPASRLWYAWWGSWPTPPSPLAPSSFATVRPSRRPTSPRSPRRSPIRARSCGSICRATSRPR